MFPRKVATRLSALIFVGFITLLLAACNPSGPQSTFGPEGPVAERQLSLFWIIFWLAVVVFILVEGVLLYMIFRFRRKPTDQGLPPQTHGNTKLEIIWTVVPAILLVIVAVPTYITIADQNSPPEDLPQLQVTVVAHQWWWEFDYPDLGVMTANELHVPVNTAVSLDLRSQDVIHSFWIPKLAGKTDVIPNGGNTMWFVAREPDSYYGQCAELCGIAHAQMRFRVISQSQEDFDRWVRAQNAPRLDPGSELVAAGQTLFGTRGCLVCHTVNGPDAPGIQQSRMNGFLAGAAIFPAPNLTTFATRTTFAGGILDNTVENLKDWVRNPEDLKPGNRMAQFAAAYQDGASLLEDDVDDLVAYLMSLKTDPGAVPPTPTPVPQATATPAGPPPTASAPSSGALEVASVGNELKFDKERLVVRAGSAATLSLVNNATSEAFQHNVVIMRRGTEDAVAAAGLGAGAGSDWIPKSDPNVIAFVPLVDGGATGAASFTAPEAGTYAFLCTFPGHSATMRGVFEVTS